MSKLLDFMLELGRDAALADEYQRAPDAVMLRAGLSDEARRAMLDRDYETIKRLSGLADGQFATNHTIFAYDQ